MTNKFKDNQTVKISESFLAGVCFPSQQRQELLNLVPGYEQMMEIIDCVAKRGEPYGLPATYRFTI